MNMFGAIFNPLLILTLNIVWHAAILWLLWRLVRALERRTL